MKCKNCGEKIETPTKRQLEAYIRVEILGRTQCEAASDMLITQPRVWQLLTNLYKKWPDLAVTREPIGPLAPFDEIDEGQIRHKF